LSSILRALKKLDAESTSPEGQKDEKQIQMKQVVTRHQTAANIRKPILLIALPLVLLAIVAWFIFKPGETEPVKETHSPTQVIAKKQPKPTKVIPKERVSKKEAVDKKNEAAAVVQKNQTKDNPIQDTPNQINLIKEKVTQAKPQQETVTQLSPTPASDGRGGLTQAQKDRLAARRSREEQSSNRSPMPSRDGRVKGGLKRYIPPASGRGIMPMANGRPGQNGRNNRSNNQPISSTPSATKNVHHPQFKLNGILWSKLPARRVVLIGDKYLKEGDKISGVTVFKIEKKTVIFQSGSETWTVRLK
jgi:outer membrane biosynthesis protein TonB